MSVAPSRNPLPPRVWRAIRSLLRAYDVEAADAHSGDIFVIDGKGDECVSFAVLYHMLDVPRPVVLNKEPLKLPGDPS